MLDTLAPEQDGAPAGRGRRGHRGLAAVVVLGLILAAAGLGVIRYVAWCKAADGPRREVTLAVPEGATGAYVAELLHARGVTRCGGLVGRTLLQNTGLDSDIRAGTYELSTNMTLEAVLEVLTASPEPVPTVRLTIPEGYRLTQIAERVTDALGISTHRFLSLAESGRWALPPYLPEGTRTPEGFLFPKTYEFVKGEVGTKQVIRKLLDQFDVEARSLPWENAEDLGATPYEVVIIASMIEREAKVPAERPKIAAVIYNRLAEGMTLGIDATLQYVDPDPSNGLTESDLRLDSPYNTRLYEGLPPTPIASPSLDSLRAALEPADATYLFYVLCGDDGHHEFSTDYDQFLQDRARCGE